MSSPYTLNTFFFWSFVTYEIFFCHTLCYCKVSFWHFLNNFKDLERYCLNFSTNFYYSTNCDDDLKHHFVLSRYPLKSTSFSFHSKVSINLHIYFIFYIKTVNTNTLTTTDKKTSNSLHISL